MWDIASPDKKTMDIASKRWDSIAKPIGSLGILEETVIKIAGLTGGADINIDKRATVVMCADNGVVAQGVSQVGCEVTAIVAENLNRGITCLCEMSKIANSKVIPVDVGMMVEVQGVLGKKTALGTRDISKEPAMTKEQAMFAVNVGIDMVAELKNEGYNLLATGEMGIGNTTTASAIAAVMMGKTPEEVTGRGSGLTNSAFEIKKQVIERAIDTNRPDKLDGLDVLSKLGGFDIAAMAGMFIGGAIYRVPILIDGFISSVAATVAKSMAPKCECAMFASHVSAEPAGKMVLNHIGLKPILCAEMRLGEGTGAVAIMPILDMAVSVYKNMSTFSQINMDDYERFDDK